MVLNLIAIYNQILTYAFERINDDDTVDRLSRKYSAIGMVLFAIIVSTYTLVGQPIRCWCPTEYSDVRCEYATTYCYITSQYIPILNGTQLPSRNEIMSRRISYYQWVAYIFLFQALLFFFPCILWRWLNRKHLYDLSGYINLIKTYKNRESEQNSIKYIAAHIETSIRFLNNMHHRGQLKRFRLVSSVLDIFKGTLLFASHLFIKFVYACSIFLQIFLLNYWISNGKSFSNITFGYHNWNLRERFPRMTMCKFTVYTLAEEQVHWMQCALPINNYLEKFYLIIWTWLCVLLMITLASLFYNFTLILYSKRNTYIHTSLMDSNIERADKLTNFLRIDGVLVLKLISNNTSEYYTNNIIKILHENLIEK